MNQYGITAHNVKAENILPCYFWSLQQECAYYLMKNNAHLTVLKNFTDVPFITGDLPIVNIYADYNTENSTNKLAFYYPLSTTIAVKINSSDEDDSIEINKQEAEQLNMKIANASDSQIFGATEQSIIGF